MYFLSLLSLLLLSFLPLTSSTKPILLSKSGGFHVSGKILTNPQNPNQTLHCDHGYLEYFIPSHPRLTSLLFWHSAHMQVFQNNWVGGPGFKDIFLRLNYPIFLFDAPRLGRANWACDPYYYLPFYWDQINFVGWQLGAQWPEFYKGVQFPTENKEAWNQATRSRYIEFDTHENLLLQSKTAAVAADEGKLGESIVLITNSVAGLRAQMSVVMQNKTNIKGIVAYESYGFVYPDNINVTEVKGGFGPVVVGVEEFKKLTRVKIQFVWGDNRDEEKDDWLIQCRKVVKLINMYGGNAEILHLAKEEGGFLRGSTHSPMADLDNQKVAGLLSEWLREKGMDGVYAQNQNLNIFEKVWDGEGPWYTGGLNFSNKVTRTALGVTSWGDGGSLGIRLYYGTPGNLIKEKAWDGSRGGWYDGGFSQPSIPALSVAAIPLDVLRVYLQNGTQNTAFTEFAWTNSGWTVGKAALPPA
ncbi:fungal fucose-specific lectin-domain-containing protein [Podospora fimiseda]|uniref:Fungal fucose-specific lectin-domain-containing protein n=1 Tax=Podospora fimiseda TaxID=252190 RepID=A0AAN6YNS8_9PEZI|nr:fungal fucose-specific lectin-domain-containing protein [Podospora fimiseda]